MQAYSALTRCLGVYVERAESVQITTSSVNLVNADLLAKTRGLRITESTVPSEGQAQPCAMQTVLAQHTRDIRVLRCVGFVGLAMLLLFIDVPREYL